MIMQETTKFKKVSIVMAIVYFAVLIKVLVLKDLAMIRVGGLFLNFGGTHEGPSNFIPFKTIYPYLLGHKGLIIAGINIIGNIILLVPLGFLMPLAMKKHHWTKMILLAMGSGLLIEILQMLFHVGIFDVDDVILNGLGFLLGYGMFLYFVMHASPLKTKIVQYSIVLFFVSASMASINYYNKNNELPIGFSPSIRMPILPSINTKGTSCEHCDLCGGTGGTGLIISLGEHTIDVKKKDGIVLHVKTTNETVIKKAEGIININQLKIGEAVTLVGDFGNQESMIAMAVLVCASQNK